MVALRSKPSAAAAAAAAAAADALELPDAAVVAILRHLPQAERLRDGALVCQAWASAAPVASSSVDKQFLACAKLPAFDAWLQRHAGHVTSVSISVGAISDDDSIRPVLRLPCERLAAGLQRLWLSGCQVQLQGGAGLPQLLTLGLSGCELSDAVRELMPRLAQLTYLYLSAGEAAQAALSSLPQLRELHLTEWGSAGTEDISLPQGLTKLQLTGLVTTGDEAASAPQTAPTTPETAPTLCRLTGLQELRLSSVAFDGGILRRMSQLAKLDVDSCKLLPLDAGEEEDDEKPQTNSKAGSAALLSGLAGLTRLRVLALEETPLHRSAEIAAQCSALTASSSLEHLLLSCCYAAEHAMPLPPGAAQHMFPAGRKLPALWNLHINCAVFATRDDYPPQDPVLSSACLRAIVESCPALHALSMIHTVQPGADIACLRQAEDTLCELSVGGEAFGDAAAAHIGGLQGLEELCWKPSQLTDLGVEKLSALVELTTLVIEQGSGISDAICNDEYMPGLRLECKRDEDEPVWRQLWQQCEASPAVAMGRLKQLRQEHEQLKASNARLWKQLRSSRAHKRTQATQTTEQ